MANNTAIGQHWLKNREILDEIANLAAGTGVEADQSALGSPAKNGAKMGSSALSSPAKNGAKMDSSALGSPAKKPLDMTCLEIGPGLGTLTSSLLRRFSRVVAVEFDEKLARNLPGSFPGKNLEVVNQDILEYDFNAIEGKYVVAGNIPYYITSPIIERVLAAERKPERVVLLMQKEVAERIVSNRETVLSLSVKNVADAELGPEVGREEFTPPPQVDSQVIVMKPHPPIVNEKVMKLIKIGFSAPRKKVTRNLSVIVPRDELKMEFVRMNMNIDVRPGELHLEDWQKVYDAVIKIMSK